MFDSLLREHLLMTLRSSFHSTYYPLVLFIAFDPSLPPLRTWVLSEMPCTGVHNLPKCIHLCDSTKFPCLQGPFAIAKSGLCLLFVDVALANYVRVSHPFRTSSHGSRLCSRGLTYYLVSDICLCV